MENNNNEVYGYSLFNDVEDKQLQERNRAAVMSNIAETNYKNEKISEKGAAIIIQYFNQIPEGERMSLYNKFVSTMNERGFQIAA